MHNHYLFLKRIFAILLFLTVPLSAFSANINDLYEDLAVLENSPKISRKSYQYVGDKFYGLYSAKPDGRSADEALLGSARSYSKAYQRFKIMEDLDKSLRFYRMLQGSFSSASARVAYLESAEIFYQRKDSASAKYTLNKLLSKFPDSNESKEAKKKLITYSSPNIEPVESVRTKNIEQPKANNIKPQAVPKSNGATVVYGIRYFSDSDYTRVVVDLKETAEYSSRWLNQDPSINKPPRLTVDIQNSKVADDIAKSINIKDGLLSGVRLGYHEAEKRTRIVLDSENVKDYTIFQMSNPPRIVIDVFADKRELAPKPTVVAKPSSNKPQISSPKVPQGDMTLGAALGLKVRTIVIDPGHGGKDPGAVYGNLLEKDIVLEISKHLRDYLKQDKDLQIFLTRDKDIFIPLEERTAIANKHKADIFISIHANASKNTKASGIETFVFNITNDKSALEVAALENQATTKSISDLQGILKDILKYSKLEESLSLAGSTQKNLISSLRMPQTKNLGVKQAPFYVLVGARMPAILVESGFITNKEDAAKLKSSSYRREVAKGIYNGLNEYISKYNK